MLRSKAVVVAVLFTLCAAPLVASADGAPVLSVPTAQAVDDGFVRVRETNWSLAGDPPRLVVCLKKEQTRQGVFVNASTCTKFGTPQQYLDARFPGNRVVLTRFDYSCSAESKTAYEVRCQPEVVLYYRIAP